MWAFYALFMSLMLAATAEANRNFKVDGTILNFWRYVMGVIFLVPVVTFIEWPKPSLFYAGAVLAGVVGSIGRAVQFNLAAKHCGRVATMYMPMQVFGGFFLWMMVDPSAAERYANNPLLLAGVLICFMVIGGAMFAVRRNDVGWHTLIMVAPLGILYAVSDVVTKSVLEELPHHIGLVAVIYTFISMVTGTMVTGSFLMQNKSRRLTWDKLVTFRHIKLGSLFAVGIIVNFSLFVIAVKDVPNPAYLSAIFMLTPVWLLLYNRLRKVPDDASPIAGTVIALAALFLILITTRAG